MDRVARLEVLAGNLAAGQHVARRGGRVAALGFAQALEIGAAHRAGGDRPRNGITSEAAPAAKPSADPRPLSFRLVSLSDGASRSSPKASSSGWSMAIRSVHFHAVGGRL
jgi:hypothetical protein